MLRMGNALSLCMMVKNEERNLPKCLESVRGLADELIVVDTGSTDATHRIAAGFGAEVIPFDFAIADFAAARNFAMARARGRWILALDADEVLDRASRPMIETLVALDENAGYFLERYNHSSDSHKSPKDYVVRLFPNRPNYRYRGRVHETIDASILAGGGRLHKTGIRIDHTFSRDREDRRRKNRWYIEILMEEIAANPNDYSRLDFLAAEYHQLEMFREAAEVAERIARVKPLDPRAHLFAGLYHLLYQPDLPRARADFNQALTLRPGYAEAQSFLQLVDEREQATPAVTICQEFDDSPARQNDNIRGVVLSP
jgi:glycosyltransferase involved in cell wall biosynthesis